MKVVKLFLVLLLMALVHKEPSAQTNSNKFQFEHLTVNEGLPHSDAMCVVEDNLGFIWIGTNDGIARYDGFELKKYKLPVNPLNGLTSNRIHVFHKQNNGTLWYGSERAGLGFYDAKNDKFVNITENITASVDKSTLQLLRKASILSIASDQSNHLYACTRDGVFALTLNNTHALEKISRIAILGNQLQYMANEVVVDTKQQVWIGTVNQGLFFLSSAQQTTAQKAPFPSETVRALQFDTKGNLWLGTDFHLYFISPAEQKEFKNFTLHQAPTTIEDMECIRIDSFRRLWVGTNFGLYCWDDINEPARVLETKPQVFLPKDDNPNSINSGRIHQVYEDSNHILWLAASAGGLNKVDLKRKPFENLQRRFFQTPTLPNNYVNAVLKDPKHNWLWIGTRNGFSKYDFDTKSYSNFANRELNGDATGTDVSTLFMDTNGTLWVGTRYNGLYILQNGTLRKIDLSIPSTSIESIIETSDGYIWIATFENGILKMDKTGKVLNVFSTTNKNLMARQFTHLLYDKAKEQIWASTRDMGVLLFQLQATDLKLLQKFSFEENNPNSLSVNFAWQKVQDPSGAIWVGTIGGGLNKIERLKNGKYLVRRINIPESNVEGILQDKQGNIWIGGSGLGRYSPKSGQWIHYDVADGIQSNSFKVGAAYQDASGILYLGGIKGVTYFNPEKIQPSLQAPTVRFTNLKIFNQTVQIGEEIYNRVVLPAPFNQLDELEIHANENDFSIEFVGLNFANPAKTSYAYKLQGYNPHWVYVGSNARVANFANLPSGYYKLYVKAHNGEGQWSKIETVTIHILPPWYQTWWAYLLYLGLVVAGLYVYRKITLRHQKLQNELLLETYKTEKEKELTDLKLRFFTNVSHELRTPLTLILGPLEEMITTPSPFRSKLLLVHQQSKKLYDLVNQLLEFRKVESGHISILASKDNIIPMLSEILLIFQLKSEEQQIDYTIDLPQEEVELFFDSSKIEIILTNLLSNAFKYTASGGKIQVTVKTVGNSGEEALFENKLLSNNYLEISIQDNGVGMEASALSQIFDPYFQASHTETMKLVGTGIGLSLVKQFIEAHHGEILVQSEIGNGTTFTIKLPCGSAHLKPEEITQNAPKELTWLQNPPQPIQSIDINHDASHAQKVLIVEDHPEVRQYIQKLFDSHYQTFTAVDGQDGLEKASQLMPDLIISDVMMPNIDGLELCRKLKQNPKTSHIPVVLLTARSAAAHQIEGLENGADEYLSKPFHPQLLQTKVQNLLHNRLLIRDYYQRQILLQPSAVSIPDDTKTFLEKAMKIVEENLSNQDFNVQELVKAMAMSQSGFYRQIKSITGQSVVEFIRDIRLKRAAQLLASTDLRVQEVATIVGIEDAKYFRKMFQQIYQYAPSEYAKIHKNAK
ncbi:two-component regulator propeller domain-containing protein [Flectobacillus sp. DC10W]|uniref:histidine kinase n=1 Tax=Flectobacillus longus TaxID=2984207 RepID=A0ABT6YGH2_9BACT|nr:two-component regulator propeller domain-containing protein [Flectobacillus longus]MDI9862698.1 two-component regulator propeller domain-containing protein [Flectobacillus longus]